MLRCGAVVWCSAVPSERCDAVPCGEVSGEVWCVTVRCSVV